MILPLPGRWTARCHSGRPYQQRNSRKHSLAEELAEVSSLGQEEETHEEFAVLDRVGRLQLPKEYLEELGLNGKDKIRVEVEDDKIILTKPAEEEPPEGETAATQIPENPEKK